MTMIANILEEEATAQQRDLERGDVDVGVEGAPSVCADTVGHEGREEAVEVEEEEDGQDAADEQLNQEHPIEAVARVQGLRDDSGRHDCSALCEGEWASSWLEGEVAHCRGERRWKEQRGGSCSLWRH